MESALDHESFYVRPAKVRSGTEFAGGAVTLPEVRDAVFEDAPSDGSIHVLIDGEIYDAADRWRELGMPVPSRGVSVAALLAAGWRKGGAGFLRSLDGYFSAALWEPQQGALTLVSDRFGMRPLYYALLPDAFVFSSEIKGLIRHPAVSRRTSLRGASQFLTFGHLLGEDTLLEGIKVLPAAAEVRYEPHSHRLTVQPYSRLTPGDPIRDEREALSLIDAAFERAVKLRTEGDLQLGLSLSGGLDARTILALVPGSARSVKTVSLGIAGSIDHRAASKLAALSGHEHHSHHLGGDFLAAFPQHLERLVFLTDGQYLDQAITIPTLGIYRSLGIRALLRGHAGELFHMDKAYAFSIRPEELGFATAADVEQWLWSHLTPYMTAHIGSTIFAQHLRAEAEAIARTSLREALAVWDGVAPPAQLLWLLFVNQRLRRETALSMQMFNAFVRVRMPYLDAQLVDLALRVEPRIKMGDRIQSYILARRAPAFLKVVNANTGTVMGAGQWRNRASVFRMKIFSRLGVPGYQPYEKLGLWLSHELQPYVRSVLLDSRTLDRGLLEPDVVRRIVDEHAQRSRNHTFMLMALLILELGQRQVEG